MVKPTWRKALETFTPQIFSAEPWRTVSLDQRVYIRSLAKNSANADLLSEWANAPSPQTETEASTLLQAPFRNPPLRYGSRFGSRLEPGIWYGSDSLSTAFAERAYYLFALRSGTDASLSSSYKHLFTSLQANVATAQGADLTRGDWVDYEPSISSPTSHDVARALGSEMRAMDVEALRFRSARATGGGTNVALFTPCFRKPTLLHEAVWSGRIRTDEIGFSSLHGPSRQLSYGRNQFLVDGAMPEIVA